MVVWCVLQWRREKEIEGEIALALIVIALAYAASPDREGMSHVYGVEVVQAEAWLRAAKLAGFVRDEPAPLEVIARIGLGILLTRRGMIAAWQIDELIHRHRSAVRAIITADTWIGRELIRQEQSGILGVSGYLDGVLEDCAKRFLLEQGFVPRMRAD